MRSSSPSSSSSLSSCARRPRTQLTRSCTNCHIMRSQFPDDPATLGVTSGDRAGWVTALSGLSSMEAAESNAQAVTRAVNRASAAAFNAWVAMMAHQSPGTLHGHVKPRDPVTSEFNEQRPTKQPFEIMDAKAQHWTQHKWSYLPSLCPRFTPSPEG